MAVDVAALFVRRFFSGVSVGLITSAATVALADLHPGRRASVPAMVATSGNTGGLGLGPLLAGFFAQYLPAPTVLAFWVFLSFVIAAGIATVFVRETHRRRAGPID
ncbi:MFS transporter [Microbacterium sp.]|uniref:MFS transporter n=1 Tax=Microbacterium sp. TaxID=51671 RepID=UPI003A8EB6EC